METQNSQNLNTSSAEKSYQLAEKSYQVTLYLLAADKLLTSAKIQDWIACYLAELLEIKQHKVDISVSFDCYGLDSLATADLTHELGNLLGKKLAPTILYDHPTIEALAWHLAEEFPTF